MLRKDTGATIRSERAGCIGQFLLGMRSGRYFYAGGRNPPSRLISDQEAMEINAAQGHTAVRLLDHGGRTWWIFKGVIYWDDEGRNADAVRLLIGEREAKERKKLDRLRRENEQE